MNIDNGQEFIWYFVDKAAEDPKNNIKGPLAERDLDVLYRTNEIDSNTFVWREGMKEWTPIIKIEKLKKTLMESADELQQIQQTVYQFLGQTNVPTEQENKQQKQQQKQNQDKQQKTLNLPQKNQQQQPQTQAQSVGQPVALNQVTNNNSQPINLQIHQLSQIKNTQTQQTPLTQQQQFMQTVAQLQQKVNAEAAQTQIQGKAISTNQNKENNALQQKKKGSDEEDNDNDNENEEDDEDDEEDDEEEDEEEEYLRTLEENPEKALELTVENLLKAKYYKADNGTWNVFDESTRTWKIQENEPLEEIKNLKSELLASLKQQFLTSKQDKQSDNKQQVNPNGNKKNKKQKQERDLSGLTQEQIKKIEKNRKKTRRANQKKKEKKHNKLMSTFIYIKNLPSDVTIDEIDQFFSRAGVIRKNAQTGEKKIKIYTDTQNKCKGDALLQYAKEESVQIALDMLNEREIKPGYMIFIERAKFNQEDYQRKLQQQKQNQQQPTQEIEGTQEPTIEKKRKIDKLQILKNKQEEKLTYGWEEEDQIEGMRIVILKNMFTLKEAQDEGPNFYKDLEEDVKLECQKIGPVLRTKIYEENSDGIIQIKFSNAASAENCINIMNKRFFAGRQIECFYWDGQTDYRKEKEKQIDEENRIAEFGKWLEQDQ